MVKIKTINIRKLGFNEFAEKPVVDVETIDAIESDNSRDKLRPSMVGIFYKDRIKQIVLENIENISKFKKTITKELDKLPQPFLAFNRDFDRSVILGFTGKPYSFKEIQEFKYQKKQDAKLQYNINVYDPFHGDGLQAVHFYQKYLKTNNKKLLNFVIQHNRACLLTEHLLYKSKNKANKIKNPIETSEIATRNLPTSVRSKRAISDCAQKHAPHFSAGSVFDKTINEAFDKRLRVKIVYPSSDLKWRKIEIYEMENDFVNAFCHLRGDMRNFRIANIQDVQLTKEKYKIPKNFPRMSFC